MRGQLSETAFAKELAVVREALEAQRSAAHWREFLAAWPEA
jgi:hypothetical protein